MDTLPPTPAVPLPPESRSTRVAINTGSRYAAMVVTTLTALLMTPFLIRALGKPSYGLQALSHQTLQFVGLIALAVGLSYQRYAADHYARGDYARMNATLSLGLLLACGSAGLLLVGTALTAAFAHVLFGLPDELVPTARAVILILGIASSCHMINGVWKAPIFIRQRFHLESVANVTATVGAALAVWGLFHWTRPSIVTWVLLAAGLRCLIEWIYVIPRARRAMPEMQIRLMARPAWSELRGLITFSALNLFGIVGYLLYYATDSILISNLRELGIAQVADYNVAQRWDPQIRMLISSFVGALTPLMTADAATGRAESLRNTVLRGTRYSLILGFGPCVLLGVLARPFLQHWLGENFAEASVMVMRLIMGGLILSVPGLVCYEALYACGRLRHAVVALVIGGLGNLAMSIGFVKIGGLGLTGIALGSVISLTLVNALVIPTLACRATGLPLRRLWREACLPPLLGAIPYAVLCLALHQVWPEDSLHSVLIQFALCGLFYAANVWVFSLTADDRTKIRRGLATAGRRLSDPSQWPNFT